MACNNPECGCSEERSTRNGRGYCSDGCANQAEQSARSHSQPGRSNERREAGCACGHPGCAH